MSVIRPVTARWIAVAALLVSLPGCAGKGGSRAEHQYNVLLVTLDTFRADRFSCYGYDKEITPRFDQLAADGIRFERAVAQAAVTPVSHASIMTGLYPYQHGVRVLFAASGYELAPEIPTISTLLQEGGWTTGAFLSAFPVSEHFGFHNGFDRFDNGIRSEPNEALQPTGDGNVRWNVAVNQRRSDVTTGAALEWLGGVDDPFFLWVHYWDPHDGAIQPPQELREKMIPLGGPLTDEVKKALYDAEVFYVDSQFGRLVDYLKEKGRYDETIVIVVADHGEGLGDHGWWSHRILYEEQIRVPLIMKLPGARAAGRQVDRLVRTIDIMPTLLDWIGIGTEGHIEGRSLRPLIEGVSEEPRMAYADQLNLFDTNAAMLKKRPNDDLVYCATDQKWKLIYRPRHPELNELYNLEADPHEMENLYHIETKEAERLLKWLTDRGGFVNEPFGESMDEETRERLRSLGYVD